MYERQINLCVTWHHKLLIHQGLFPSSLYILIGCTLTSKSMCNAAMLARKQQVIYYAYTYVSPLYDALRPWPFILLN